MSDDSPSKTTPEEAPDWIREHIDRDRGILTPRDREFLLTELAEELNANAVTQKRYQIRQRTRNALLDFYVLQSLPNDEIDLIFDDYTGEFDDGATPSPFDLGVRFNLDFLLRGLGINEFCDLTEEVLRHAMQMREVDERVHPHLVEATVEVNRLTPEDVRQRQEDGENLTEQEEAFLRRYGSLEFTDETLDSSEVTNGGPGSLYRN